MIEQRRDAHRGSAGLSLTWQGLISRVRLLSRYMSVYRRLLTVGMRPLHATTAPATPSPAPATTTRNTPPLSARRESSSDEGMVMGRGGKKIPATGASGLRSSLDGGGMGLPEESLLLTTGPSADGEGASVNAGGDGRGGGEEHWDTNWFGGSSAEIRKLAEQIRTRFGRGALVRKHYSTAAQRELQVSRGGGGGTHRRGWGRGFYSRVER